MNSDNKIHLVLGVSSVGKSSYIEWNISKGVWENTPLLMACELDKDSNKKSFSRTAVIHYNLFRPYKNSAENLGNDFLTDPVLSKLLELKDRIKAHFLITQPSEVAKRCLLRQESETNHRQTKSSYPHQTIFELLCRVDFVEFYKKWFSLLKKHGIDFEIIQSGDVDCPVIASEELAISILESDHRPQYSDQEIEYIISTNKFEYQQIKIDSETSDLLVANKTNQEILGRRAKAIKSMNQLANSAGLKNLSNLRTAGVDRSPTLRFLDGDLTGKSVLDIGCAYGFFCFEAEKRNASRVVGTELKQHRFIGCNIVKEIYGSNAKILRQDIFSEPLNESFDIILFLNVLHHLPEPVKALRMISKMCNEKLIIEFPTLADERFTATLPAPIIVDQSAPLIGVSLLSQQDQTFMFSHEAIRRIFMDHEQLFSRIDFEQSPMNPNRSVAICYK